MRSTRQLSVTLPHEMAAAVRSRVASGAYASESEVIREGLRALEAREKAEEAWLRGPVADAFDALEADVSRARPIAAVRETLRREHGRALQPGE
ncbi:MAG TPA: type II toxin-antitoxin system ParD family antitoxin [Allosphingosinicella sp.]|jgi:putative addiction module CopG family antidote|nr:type II toxin-antitoxin system ParD family antitoxin [Allosphingosinicella sp.]